MLTGKTIIVEYHTGDGQNQKINMDITGKQLEQTVQRRMATLMPNATILGMTDADTLKKKP